MRLVTLTLAMLGLLLVGTMFAVAQQPTSVPPTPSVAPATDPVVVVPARRYVYRPAPGWYGYYRSRPYYTYRPRYYWYGPRYVMPYWSYYYDPNGFRFEFNGPRRSFSFGF